MVVALISLYMPSGPILEELNLFHLPVTLLIVVQLQRLLQLASLELVRFLILYLAVIALFAAQF